MAQINPTTLTLKDGRTITIRTAGRADAAGLMELINRVRDEDDYNLSEPGEIKLTVETEEKWINEHLTHPLHLALVAEFEGEIVGQLVFSNGHRRRIAHTGEFGIKVHRPFRGHGVGQALLCSLFDWAVATTIIEKICLKVHSTNYPAIALYRKLGFLEEGILKRDIKYDVGQYVDTILMAKFFRNT